MGALNAYLVQSPVQSSGFRLARQEKGAHRGALGLHPDVRVRLRVEAEPLRDPARDELRKLLRRTVELRRLVPDRLDDPVHGVLDERLALELRALVHRHELFFA
jgi:hypothetical protein